MPGLDKSRHRLWVEGHDDLYVISNLMNRRLPGPPFTKEEATRIIQHSGNFDGALEAFAVALKNQRLECAGLVVDMDSPRDKRWERVREVLGEVIQDVPEAIPPSGLIVERSTKPARWGIWLMPDNQQFGEIEHFVASLGPSFLDLYNHAQASVGVAAKMTGAFHSKDEVKATLHTYLAYVEEPGRPYGDAIARKHFGESSSAADAFTEWFKRLFLGS